MCTTMERRYEHIVFVSIQSLGASSIRTGLVYRPITCVCCGTACCCGVVGVFFFFRVDGGNAPCNVSRRSHRECTAKEIGGVLCSAVFHRSLIRWGGLLHFYGFLGFVSPGVMFPKISRCRCLDYSKRLVAYLIFLSYPRGEAIMGFLCFVGHWRCVRSCCNAAYIGSIAQRFLAVSSFFFLSCFEVAGRLLCVAPFSDRLDAGNIPPTVVLDFAEVSQTGVL